jgi:hypothetical protein
LAGKGVEAHPPDAALLQKLSVAPGDSALMLKKGKNTALLVGKVTCAIESGAAAISQGSGMTPFSIDVHARVVVPETGAPMATLKESFTSMGSSRDVVCGPGLKNLANNSQAVAMRELLLKQL